MLRSLLIFVLMIWMPLVLAVSDIANSRHNLSASSGNAVSAGTLDEICIFCHTPHSSAGDAPLWNRTLPSGQIYQLYDSTSLQANIVDPQTRPGSYSLWCLSCHDGTIALGDFVNPSQEELTFTFAPTDRGYLGTDFRDDHPFSFIYNDTLATNDGLLHFPGVGGAGITPLPLQGGQYVECTTCHDVHDNTYAPFLQVQSLNGAICLVCHDETLMGINTTTSTHFSSTETGTGGTPWSDRRTEWIGANVKENSCMNCHKPHSAPTPARLLKGDEEAACYFCHNSSTTNISDIQTDAAKTYSHPIDAINGQHDLERLETTALATIHAECPDCHNPHKVETPTNPMVTLDSGGTPVPSHTGEANTRIQGVLGTTDGINFSTIVSGDKQYKLCYKCHGLDGKGPCPGSGYTGERCSSVNNATLTVNTMDKRVDRVYNIREKFIASYQAPPEGSDTGTTGYSFHPIEQNNPANNSVISTLKTGLNASTTIIYCTDCHNSDGSQAGDGTGAEGPHGSVNGAIMARNYSLVIDVAQPTANTFAICYKCHDQAVIESDVWGFPHNAHINARGGGCVLCHDPHGSRFRPRLINFWWEDPAINREGIDCETRDRKSGLCDYSADGFSPRWDYNGSVGSGGSCLLSCHGTGHSPKTY